MKIGKVHGRNEVDLVVIVTSLVSLWSQTVGNVAERLDQSVMKGFHCGDLTPGVAVSLWFHLLAGEHLGEMERLHRSFHSTIRDLQSDDTATLWMLPSYQYILNLRSENASSWRNLTELTGDIMIESAYVVRALEATADTLWTILWTYKLQLEFHFGFHSAAEKTFENLKPYVLTTALSYHMHAMMIAAFIGSLNFYAQSRERMQKHYLRKARRYKRHIEKLKIGSRPNILPLIAILEAEDLSHQKRIDPELLAWHFDKAIAVNATVGFVHMEALANEHAGFAFGHRGDWQRAEVFFERAISLHANELGAKNKAAWLRDKSEQMIKRLKKDDARADSAQGFSVDTIQVSPDHQPH
jgi:tetratricopeptide (TPR) repeat protein